MIYILKRPTTAAGATIASLREGSFSEMRSALNLSERQSTLTLTVDDTAPEIAVGAWLEDGTDPGKGIVWRVKSVDTDYATGIRTIQCEHLIRILKDSVMFGEVTPADIAGKKSAKECTAKAAAQHILKSSPAWTLGSFGFSHSAPYSFNGEDLLSALETVSGSLLDAWWTYDFDKYPFKVNIEKKSDNVISEMRMSRNIRTLKRTIDMSRMYTRFYPIGKNNLKLSGGGYVEKNTKAYGVVSKVETDSEKDTQEKLKAWANERLALHAEPSVTVTISGMELADATGEPLDRLTLGRICRVPLSEYGTIITERITRLSYGDKIADPEAVTVTLANAQEDVASIISQIQKSASRGGRAGAKKNEEDHAWFVDTTDHVGMVAEAVAGPGADKDWSRVSSIFADGKGIHQRVVKTEGDVKVAEANIEIAETKIGMVVTGTSKDGYKIKAAEIVTSINRQTGKSSVLIDADHIQIGTGTAAVKMGDKITVASGSTWMKGTVLFGDAIQGDQVRIGGYMVDSKTVRLRGTPNIDLTAASLKTAIQDASISNDVLTFKRFDNAAAVTVSVSGNTLTFKDSTGAKINFSKATSLSGKWSGTVKAGKYYQVTASPQGTKHYSPSLDGLTFRAGKTWAADKKSFTQTFYVYDEDGEDLYEEDLTIDTEVSYNQGKSDVTLGGSWKGTVIAGKSYEVTASNGKIKASPALDGLTFRAGKTWAADKKSFTQTFYVYDEDGTDLYEENLTIDTTDAWNAGRDSVVHKPDIPLQQIYTSGTARGTRLDTLKTRYEQAKADAEYVMFRVDCGGTQKWYYMEP